MPIALARHQRRIRRRNLQRRRQTRRTRTLLPEMLEPRHLLTNTLFAVTGSYYEYDFANGNHDVEEMPGTLLVYRSNDDDLTDSVDVTYSVEGYGIAAFRATPGEDMSLVSGSTTIPAGQWYVEVPFVIYNDELPEGDLSWEEHFTVSISNFTSNPAPGKSAKAYEYAHPHPFFSIIDDDDSDVGVRASTDDPIVCDCPCTCTDVSTSFNLLSGNLYATSTAGDLKYDAEGAGPWTVLGGELNVGVPPRPGADLRADFEINGVSAGSETYDLEGIHPGIYRFAHAVVPEDGNDDPLPSGNYTWTANFFFTDTLQPAGSISGKVKVRNYTDSEFGAGWIATGVDKLIVSNDANGNPTSTALSLRGDSNAFQFDQGQRQQGEVDRSVLSMEVTESVVRYRLENKSGEKMVFTLLADSNIAVLTYRADRNGNVTGYTYVDADGDDVADELSTITDPSGRVTQYDYDGGPRVKRIVDPYGRTTSLTYDGNRLTTITEPDPDGAGPLSAPKSDFTYSNGLLTSVKDAEEKVTTFSFSNFSGFKLLSGITHPGGGVESIYSQQAQILTERLVLVSDLEATQTTESNQTWQYKFNKFGNPTAVIDPLNNKTEFEIDDDNQVSSRIDPAPGYGPAPGQRPITRYFYDANKNIAKVMLPNGGAIQLDYEPDFGQVTRHVDPLGQETHFTVNPNNGNVTQIRQIVGQHDHSSGESNDLVTTFTYTQPTPDLNDRPAGLVASVTDPLNRLTTYGYVGGGLVSSISSAVGTPDEAKLTFGYNSAENLIWSGEEVSPNVYRYTSYEYDQLHRLTKMTLPPGEETVFSVPTVYKYEYDKNDRLIKEIDPLERTTQYVYTARGDIEQIKRPDHDNNGQTTNTTFAYDNHRRLTSITDPLGRVTSFTYDALDRQISVRQPNSAGGTNGPLWQTRYDNLGRVRQEIDPLGNVTDYEYVGFLNEASVILPDPDGTAGVPRPVIRQIFDAGGRLIEEINSSVQTKFEYDKLGRLLRILEPSPESGLAIGGPQWHYTYNKLGQLTEETDPEGRITSYEYDALDRLKKTILPDPDGAGGEARPEIEYTYDLAGNLSQVIDPLNHVTKYEYDNLDRLTKTKEWQSTTTPSQPSQTTYSYDLAGNLKSLTDPRGNVTTWTYNALDQVIEERNPLNALRTYKYDAAGNLTERVDRLGRKIVYEYDQLNRNTAEKWFDQQAVLQRTITFTYDAVGQLRLTNDLSPTNTSLSATYRFDYDPLGRVVREYQDLAGLMNDDGIMVPDVQYDHTYDGYGNRSHLMGTIDGYSDFRNFYAHDRLGRLTSVAQRSGSSHAVEGKLINFTYNDAGQVEKMSRVLDFFQSPVASTYYDYDGMGRPKTLLHTTSVSPPLPLGEGWGEGALAGYKFTYDAASRITAIDSKIDGLTSYTYDNTSQLLGANHASHTDESYTYDANGNRTMAGYQTGPNNRLINDGTYTYQYDTEGNRVSRAINGSNEITAYEYDHRNRLVTVGANFGTRGVDWDWGLASGGGSILKTAYSGEGSAWGWDENQVTLNNTVVCISSNDGNEVSINALACAALEGESIGVSIWVDDPYGGDHEGAEYNVWTSDGTAVENQDYGPLWWEHLVGNGVPGNAGTSVSTYSDSLAEGWETVLVHVGPCGISMGCGDWVDPLAVPIFESWPTVTATAQAATEGSDVVVTIEAADFDANISWSVNQYSAVWNEDFSGGLSGNGVAGTGANALVLTFPTTDDAVVETTEAFFFNLCINGICDSIEAQILDNDAGSFSFQAEVQPTTEGNDIGLTISSSAWLPFEWWTVQRTATSATDFMAATGGGTISGVGIFNIGTREDELAEKIESLEIHVQIVGFPSSKVVLEADILDDDITISPNQVSYTYDVFNQLIRRTHDVYNETGLLRADETFYSYEGGQITLQFDGTTVEHLSHRYLWNPQAVDQLLADEQLPPLPGEGASRDYMYPTGWAGTVYWPLADHLGTIRDIAIHDIVTHDPLELETTIENHRFYDSFGNLISETNAAVDEIFGYTGRLWDEVTGLQDNLFRKYDPKTGTFTAEDPIGFAAGDTNIQRYVGNNPLSNTDPSGLQSTNTPAGVQSAAANAAMSQGATPEAIAATKTAKAVAAATALAAQRAIARQQAAQQRAAALKRVAAQQKAAKEAAEKAAKEAAEKAAKDCPEIVTKKATKRGPKIDPDAPHNAKIREEAAKLRAEGNEIVSGGGGKERLIETPGGNKSGRRPDIEYRTPDGQMRGRNVGKTKADGSPVKRESEALDDLNGPGKLPTDFVPYDR